MGTNFYAVAPGLPTADNGRGLHIGKSSAGWLFGFRAYPDAEPPLTSWQEWQRFLKLPGVAIMDEYGDTHSAEDFPTRANVAPCSGQVEPEAGKRSCCDACYMAEHHPVIPPDWYHDDEGFALGRREFS